MQPPQRWFLDVRSRIIIIIAFAHAVLDGFAGYSFNPRTVDHPKLSLIFTEVCVYSAGWCYQSLGHALFVSECVPPGWHLERVVIHHGRGGRQVCLRDSVLPSEAILV